MKYKLSCGLRIILLWGLCCGLSLLNPPKILAQTSVSFSLVILPAPEVKPEIIVVKNEEIATKNEEKVAKIEATVPKNEEKVIEESNPHNPPKWSFFDKIRINFLTDWLDERSFSKTSFYLPSLETKVKNQSARELEKISV